MQKLVLSAKNYNTLKDKALKLEGKKPISLGAVCFTKDDNSSECFGMIHRWSHETDSMSGKYYTVIKFSLKD